MKRLVLIAPIFIITAAVLWGVDSIVLRPALYSLPVAVVVLVEHLLAFLIMLPLFLKEWRGVKALKSGDWGAMIWVAVFGGVIGTMCITKALFYVDFVNLSIVVLIQKLQPVFAIALASIVLKERLPKQFFFWAMVALFGTYFLTFGIGWPNLSTGNKTLLAALFSLGAAFAWGSSTVFSKRALQTIGYRLGTYLRFGLTSLLMIGLVTATGQWGGINQITQSQLLTFLLIVFTSGAAAMFIYYYGLQKVPASLSTIYELAFPLSAIVLEFFVHNRFLSIAQWVGAMLLLIAMYQVSHFRTDPATV